jgi:hypothetical protein
MNFRISFDAGIYIYNGGYIVNEFDGSGVMQHVHAIRALFHGDKAVLINLDCASDVVPSVGNDYATDGVWAGTAA